MEQWLEVIFTDFRTSKKNVNRLVSVGILFVLVGHFYVVERYFQYRTQEHMQKEALREKEQKWEELSGQLDRIRMVSQDASKTLDDIRRQIKGFPAHLRNMLPEIDKALQSGPSFQQYQQYTRNRAGKITLPPQITTFAAGVHWYIEDWFKNLIEKLEKKVITPILKIEHVLDKDGASNLKQLSKKATEELRVFLGAVDPDFWRSYGGPGGKEDVASQLQQEVQASFGPVVSKLSNLLKDTEAIIEHQEKSLTTTQGALEKIQARIGELESRINSLKSPLGPIPLDLTDLIILFPLFIVTLVVMLALAVRKSGQLYILLWRKLGKERGDTDSVAFQHYSDCWYLPPYGNFAQPLTIFAWLAIVTGIFVRASLLVSGEPELFISLAGEVESLKHSMFVGAYIVGMVVIIASVWFSGKTLRLVSQGLIRR